MVKRLYNKLLIFLFIGICYFSINADNQYLISVNNYKACFSIPDVENGILFLKWAEKNFFLFVQKKELKIKNHIVCINFSPEISTGIYRVLADVYTSKRKFLKEIRLGFIIKKKEIKLLTNSLGNLYSNTTNTVFIPAVFNFAPKNLTVKVVEFKRYGRLEENPLIIDRVDEFFQKGLLLHIFVKKSAKAGFFKTLLEFKSGDEIVANVELFGNIYTNYSLMKKFFHFKNNVKKIKITKQLLTDKVFLQFPFPKFEDFSKLHLFIIKKPIFLQTKVNYNFSKNILEVQLSNFSASDSGEIRIYAKGKKYLYPKPIIIKLIPLSKDNFKNYYIGLILLLGLFYAAYTIIKNKKSDK